MLATDRPRAERLHLGIQRRAHPRDLQLRDALEPGRPLEFVDFPVRDPWTYASCTTATATARPVDVASSRDGK